MADTLTCIENCWLCGGTRETCDCPEGFLVCSCAYYGDQADSSRCDVHGPQTIRRESEGAYDWRRDPEHPWNKPCRNCKCNPCDCDPIEGRE